MNFRLQDRLNDVSYEERVTILYEYLVLGRNMDEIAFSYYDNKNWSVSAVCQGYSEKGGVNRGKVRATIQGVGRFVSMYPNGTYEIGITLSDFVSNKAFEGQYQRTTGNNFYNNRKIEIGEPLKFLAFGLAILIFLFCFKLLFRWWLLTFVGIVFFVSGLKDFLEEL